MTQNDTQVLVSVVIASLDRSPELLNTLSDLTIQTLDQYEVIVIDQSQPFDAIVEAKLADMVVPTQYHHLPDLAGLPKARNHGWRRARGNIVVFVDDDIRCDARFLAEHVAAHTNTDVALVAGGITEARGDTCHKGPTGGFNWWTATPIANFHLPSAKWCMAARGANFSIKRTTLESLGGFDECLTVGAALYEETELGLRMYHAGYECWFAPKAHVTHLAAPAGGCRVGPDIHRYMFGLGHNRAIIIFRHLRWWHYPTALLRLLALGFSFSRAHRSLRPLASLIVGALSGIPKANSPQLSIRTSTV